MPDSPQEYPVREGSLVIKKKVGVAACIIMVRYTDHRFRYAPTLEADVLRRAYTAPLGQRHDV
jgi:hypothetical protein